MGHCDSSPRFRGERKFRGSLAGDVEIDSTRTVSRATGGEIAGIDRERFAVVRWFLLTMLIRFYKNISCTVFWRGVQIPIRPVQIMRMKRLRSHGARRGVLLALKRLARCRPLFAGWC